MDTPQAPPQPVLGPDARSFLALGDSYTIGEQVSANDRWPVQLVNMLGHVHIAVSAPRIIARTGWTTSELQAAIAQENLTNTYDLVSLLIGVNNQYRGQPLEQYRKEFRALLQTATKLAKGQPERVLVLSIPDWGVTPFGKNADPARIAREIDAFNVVAREETQKSGIAFIDITPISRTAVDNPALIASDNLHFSGTMYTEWAKLALPAAAEILRP